jgi:hypothetical protein
VLIAFRGPTITIETAAFYPQTVNPLPCLASSRGELPSVGLVSVESAPAEGAPHSPIRGQKETCKFPIWSLAMFKVPAYDPFAIAIMGFGILVVVALAFTF